MTGSQLGRVESHARPSPSLVVSYAQVFKTGSVRSIAFVRRFGVILESTPAASLLSPPEDLASRSAAVAPRVYLHRWKKRCASSLKTSGGSRIPSQ
ncbi:hypothetical protein JG688_00016334 [Phytophthora aleatoria]|uniref:Uncharacterized protein n=1 Tax=Phytophthora aleatoria TaxID=2496075 RepID=A0A8J5IYD2_9STRA|nr:hypothetical protein JG688_00016334 [Phytophthora aleatoria]